jgi:hypothetical protein
MLDVDVVVNVEMPASRAWILMVGTLTRVRAKQTRVKGQQATGQRGGAGLTGRRRGWSTFEG